MRALDVYGFAIALLVGSALTGCLSGGGAGDSDDMGLAEEAGPGGEGEGEGEQGEDPICAHANDVQAACDWTFECVIGYCDGALNPEFFQSAVESCPQRPENAGICALNTCDELFADVGPPDALCGREPDLGMACADPIDVAVGDTVPFDSAGVVNFPGIECGPLTNAVVYRLQLAGETVAVHLENMETTGGGWFNGMAAARADDCAVGEEVACTEPGPNPSDDPLVIEGQVGEVFVFIGAYGPLNGTGQVAFIAQ